MSSDGALSAATWGSEEHHSPAAAANVNKGSERWEPTITRSDGGTRLDVVALATWQRLVQLVPRSCRANRRQNQEIMIVALARKLLVALWRYVKDGVIPEGAKMKTA